MLLPSRNDNNLSIETVFVILLLDVVLIKQPKVCLHTDGHFVCLLVSHCSVNKQKVMNASPLSVRNDYTKIQCFVML